MKARLPLWATIMVFLISSINAQTVRNSIVIGVKDSINSTVLNEKRSIWISLPHITMNTESSEQRYPVVYLLDGDAHLYSVMGMIHQLSEINGNMICPDMIVVGIVNTDRTRDLTPSHITANPEGDTASVRTSGGGEIFLKFIEQELIPHIDSLYPTAPYRMFIGHSLGGLTVLNTLLNHTSMFNSYVAIDPSLWWDNQRLLKQADSILSKRKFDNKSLFLAVANTMDPGMDTTSIRTDTAASSHHIRSIFECINKFEKHGDNGLRWKWKYYNEDNHGSVPLIAEYDALHFIFSDYTMTPEHFFDSTFNIDSAFAAHFEKVSRMFTYKVLPAEGMINELGYAFLGKRIFSKAYSCFKMNVNNYPNSMNVFDSMGDYYAATGDDIKAIECYTKAYAINKWEETKRKLEQLRTKK